MAFVTFDLSVCHVEASRALLTVTEHVIVFCQNRKGFVSVCWRWRSVRGQCIDSESVCWQAVALLCVWSSPADSCQWYMLSVRSLWNDDRDSEENERTGIVLQSDVWIGVKRLDYYNSLHDFRRAGPSRGWSCVCVYMCVCVSSAVTDICYTCHFDLSHADAGAVVAAPSGGDFDAFEYEICTQCFNHIIPLSHGISITQRTAVLRKDRLFLRGCPACPSVRLSVCWQTETGRQRRRLRAREWSSEVESDSITRCDWAVD